MTQTPWGAAPPQQQTPNQANANDDVFGQTNTKAVSFALTDPQTNAKTDPPINSFITLDIREPGQKVVETDYDTRQPATWPDGNPKYAAVLKGELKADTTGANTVGETLSLWASIPSALFRAIQQAQAESGSIIGANGGGLLHVLFLGRTEHTSQNARGEKPKAYAAKYEPHGGNAFAQSAQQAAPATQQQTQAAPVQQAPAVQAAPPVQQTAPVQAAPPVQPAAPAAGPSPWDVAPSTQSGTPPF